MKKTNNLTSVSRRKFVRGAGAASAAAALSSLFGIAPALATGRLNPSSALSASSRIQCALVHPQMSEKLMRIVADPEVSAAETSLALRTTRCPACNTQITASYPIVPWSEIAKAYG